MRHAHMQRPVQPFSLGSGSREACCAAAWARVVLRKGGWQAEASNLLLWRSEVPRTLKEAGTQMRSRQRGNHERVAGSTRSSKQKDAEQKTLRDESASKQFSSNGMGASRRNGSGLGARRGGFASSEVAGMDTRASRSKASRLEASRIRGASERLDDTVGKRFRGSGDGHW